MKKHGIKKVDQLLQEASIVQKKVRVQQGNNESDQVLRFVTVDQFFDILLKQNVLSQADTSELLNENLCAFLAFNDETEQRGLLSIDKLKTVLKEFSGNSYFSIVGCIAKRGSEINRKDV